MWYYKIIVVYMYVLCDWFYVGLFSVLEYIEGKLIEIKLIVVL